MGRLRLHLRSSGFLTPVYDARFGTATDASGWFTFGLHALASRVWCSGAGNDANDGLTPATAVLTYKHAWSIYQPLDQANKGCQLMLAQGYTYTDDANASLYGFTNINGLSATYPAMVLSYDPADPTNAAKYGRASGANVPILLSTANASSMTSASGASGYFGAQGIEFQGRSSLNAYQSDIIQVGGSAGTHPGIVFQNCRFNRIGLTFGSVSVSNVSKSSFFNGQGIYADDGGTGVPGDAMWFQDLFCAHNGWTIGASRLDTVANGAAQVFTHTFYLHAGATNTRMDRIISLDSSNEGVGTRAGCIGSQWVSIDAPAAFLGAGFSTALTEQPLGALFQLDDAMAMGSDIIDNAHPSAGALQLDNLQAGSRVTNLALFDDPAPTTEGVFNYVRKYDVNGEIASHFTLDKCSTWNYGYSQGTLGYVDNQFPTRQGLNITNSVFQSTIDYTLAYSAPGNVNYTWASTLSGSAATAVSARSIAPIGYLTKNQVISNLGFASKAALVNLGCYRPDLAGSLAQAALTIGLPAMGLIPQYANVSPPSVVGITPPAYYPTALINLTISSTSFVHTVASSALLSGTSANSTLSSADLPTGFTLAGRLVSCNGTTAVAGTYTVHILETSQDTLGTHTTIFTFTVT